MNNDNPIQEYAKALMDYSVELGQILNRLERALEVSEPLCGDHIRPISDCGCKL